MTPSRHTISQLDRKREFHRQSYHKALQEARVHRKALSQLHYTDDTKQEVKAKIFVDYNMLADTLLNTINEYYHIDIKSNSRERNFVQGRFFFYKYMREHTTLSLKVLATFICNHDHSTVIYALKKFDDLHKTDRQFRQDYNEIISKIEL
jgi:chromosomal replication initiation ATPase DnaA